MSTPIVLFGFELFLHFSNNDIQCFFSSAFDVILNNSLGVLMMNWVLSFFTSSNWITSIGNFAMNFIWLFFDGFPTINKSSNKRNSFLCFSHKNCASPRNFRSCFIKLSGCSFPNILLCIPIRSISPPTILILDFFLLSIFLFLFLFICSCYLYLSTFMPLYRKAQKKIPSKLLHKGTRMKKKKRKEEPGEAER